MNWGEIILAVIGTLILACLLVIAERVRLLLIEVQNSRRFMSSELSDLQRGQNGPYDQLVAIRMMIRERWEVRS